MRSWKSFDRWHWGALGVIVIFLALFIVFLVLYLTNRPSDMSRMSLRDMVQRLDKTHPGLRFAESLFDRKFTVMNPEESLLWVSPEQPSMTHPPKTTNQRKFPVPDNLGELTQRAMSQFSLGRYAYAQEELHKKPLITIVTRTYKGREAFLRKNLQLCAQMLDRDFEHVVLYDLEPRGSGMQVAEAALHAFRHEFEGEYICHLDDDDYLLNATFVSDVRMAVAAMDHPKLIFFRVWHKSSDQFMPLVWKTFPTEGQVTTSNVLFRKDLYDLSENSGAVAQPHAGDYLFIYNALLDCKPQDLGWINGLYFYISDRNSPVKPLTLPKSFITVHLMGGLGNQLFEVATAYAVAKDQHKTLILDHSVKEVGDRRTYFDNVMHWTKDDRSIGDRHWTTFQETDFSFAPIPIIHGNTKLLGYFQSAKYFDRYRKELTQLFMSRILSKNQWQWPAEHQNRVRVSLHVRRGDYVGNTYHTNQPLTYYRRALEVLKRNWKNEKRPVTLVVFSDDMSWCQEHLPSIWHDEKDEQKPAFYFTPSEWTDLKDLEIMTQCDHHIIANSSFSWWGAYMDLKASSQTAAPEKWFNKDNMNWQDIYVPGWHVVSST